MTLFNQPFYVLAEDIKTEDVTAEDEMVLDDVELGQENENEASADSTAEDISQENIPVEESSEAVKDENAVEVMALDETENVRYSLQYQTHSQKIGWQEYKKDGEQAGTVGQSKRMEAISITVNKEYANPENPEEILREKIPGAIQYRVHCQKYGDMNWASDGAIAGTSGESKRMEAIQIVLTGEVAEKYDVWYQVYCAGFGYMGWAKNGEWAGSNGYSRSIEAITIMLKEKGSTDAPVKSSISYVTPTCKGDITYASHVQTYGWLECVADGEISGTQGQKKRMEALKLYLGDIRDDSGNVIEGSIEYQVHCQKYGWMDWVSEGNIAGTSGESKRLEALKICLTGDIANYYDVYYRVHSSKWGTLGWAKNGEIAGTSGYSRAVESLEIKLVKKDGNQAPVQNERSYLDSGLVGTCNFIAYMQGSNAQYSAGNDAVLGNAGTKEIIDAVALQVGTGEIAGRYSGDIIYSVYVREQGWLDNVSNGAVAGLPGQNKPVEAIKISLTGELEKYCDIYYRAYIEEYGWLGWAKNGQPAGSSTINYKMEAMQIKIVYKGASAPGNIQNSYIEKKVSNSVWVPDILQNPELPTGCESVALTIALRHYGYNIGKTVIADSYLPYSSNYAIGFSGNPYTYYGGGCFAPAITTAANKFLTSKSSSYRANDITGTNFQELYNYIDRGYPVIVWGTMYMKTPQFTGASVSWNGRRYLWYRLEHCMVLYGYDKKSDTVQISDPLLGYVTRNRADFEYLYNITGKNAVVIQ